MKSHDGTLTLALTQLAVLSFAVSFVRMREAEESLVNEDPMVHSQGYAPPTP
jgi:hypothetical protein